MARLNLVSQATFTDDPAGTLRYSTEFQPVTDDTYIRNHITVTAADGTTGRTGSGIAVDTTSAADYGVIVHEVNAATSDGGIRQGIAEYLLYLYKDPRERLPEIELAGVVNPSSAWPAILGLEVGEAIDVVWRDGLSGSKTLNVVIEGMTFAGDHDKFMVKAKTSPRDTRTYLQINHATLGKIGAAFGNRLPGSGG